MILATLCGLGNLVCGLENLKVWSTFDNLETLHCPLPCLTIIHNLCPLTSVTLIVCNISKYTRKNILHPYSQRNEGNAYDLGGLRVWPPKNSCMVLPKFIIPYVVLEIFFKIGTGASFHVLFSHLFDSVQNSNWIIRSLGVLS